MTIFERPYSATLAHPLLCRIGNKSGSMRFAFGKGAKAPGGAYWIRGGVCWPAVDPVDDRLYGFALILGLHDETRVFYVLRELEFEVYEPVIERGALLAEIGSLEPLMREAVETWGCPTLYCDQDDVTVRRWRREISRQKTPWRRPSVVRVARDSAGVGTAFVLGLLARHQLKGLADGMVSQRLAELAANESALESPPIKAMASALAGAERVFI